MVGFICQTNVKNTIPQAQSLWQHGQLFFVRLAAASCPSEREGRSSQQHVCFTPAISQTAVQERANSASKSSGGRDEKEDEDVLQECPLNVFHHLVMFATCYH